MSDTETQAAEPTPPVAFVPSSGALEALDKTIEWYESHPNGFTFGNAFPPEPGILDDGWKGCPLALMAWFLGIDRSGARRAVDLAAREVFGCQLNGSCEEEGFFALMAAIQPRQPGEIFWQDSQESMVARLKLLRTALAAGCILSGSDVSGARLLPLAS